MVGEGDPLVCLDQDDALVCGVEEVGVPLLPLGGLRGDFSGLLHLGRKLLRGSFRVPEADVAVRGDEEEQRDPPDPEELSLVEMGEDRRHLHRARL